MATEPYRAKVRVPLKNDKGQTCARGANVIVWGPIEKPPYFVEFQAEDDSLAAGVRYEFYEAGKGDLNFIQ